MSNPVKIYQGLNAEEFASWKEVARSVAGRLRDTLIERDRANKDPLEEIDWLRQSGLLKLAVPKEYNGGGANLVQALEISRIISAGDGSIGQLIAYHYSNGVWSYILGSREQWEFIVNGIAQQGWFQSSISNPRDPKLQLEIEGDDYYVSGKRTFATGASVSQVMTIAVWVGDKLVNFQVPANQPGITFNADWDNLGQRLTASGSLVFDRVKLNLRDKLTGLDENPQSASLRNGLRNAFSQLIFVHFYLGIAEGALQQAAEYHREFGRPWPESGLESALDDPYHRLLAGELSSELAAGIALAEKAAVHYQLALEQGDAITTEQWGELTVLIDQAKVIATKVSLRVTQDVFDITGGRSTANKYGFDVYWRNVRTHTLHDPVAYRTREVGDYVLSGVLPQPRIYTTPKS